MALPRSMKRKFCVVWMMAAETRFDPDAIVLSVEQQAAHDAVFAQIFEKKPAAFLLHGVTGSR